MQDGELAEEEDDAPSKKTHTWNARLRTRWGSMEYPLDCCNVNEIVITSCFMGKRATLRWVIRV